FRNARCKLLAAPERKLVNPVPTEAVRRNFARVSVTKTKSLAGSEVGLAEDAYVLGHGVPPVAGGIDTTPTVIEPTSVVSGHGVNIGIEPLERQAIREPALDVRLKRAGVQEAIVLDGRLATTTVPVRFRTAGVG